MMDTAELTRTDVRELASCPACDAPVGERCCGARGRLRESNHRERVDAAERARWTPAVRRYTRDD